MHYFKRTSCISLNNLKLKQLHFLCVLSVDCEPCDTTELLSQTIASTTTTGTDLQALPLASLHPLPDPSCGFRPDEPSFQDALVPEQPLNLEHAFMASQMSGISMSMTAGLQNTAGSEVASGMMDRWVCRME